MAELSKRAFELVTRMFREVSGINLVETKHSLVSGRLQRLAQEAGEDNLDEYVERLARGNAPAAEMTRVIDRLTTNETYFFREPQHYNDLADRARAHRPGQEFTVWSAASSTGEEAYGVAMVLTEVMGSAPWRVVGTDLSTSVVEAARNGLYSMERGRLIPEAYLKRFCMRGQGEHEGQLLVRGELRQRVSFQAANLMQPLPQLPMFDVIFLRNVLIYFDNEAKAQIVRRVLTQLKPAGVLYTGHAESLSTLNLPVRAVATAIHVHA